MGADASHAWFAVFEPTLGWIDFDPTNNILADEQHLTLAWGRDYADVDGDRLHRGIHRAEEHHATCARDYGEQRRAGNGTRRP